MHGSDHGAPALSAGLLVVLVIGAIVLASFVSAVATNAFDLGVDKLIRRLVKRPDKDFERYKNGS